MKNTNMFKAINQITWNLLVALKQTASAKASVKRWLSFTSSSSCASTNHNLLQSMANACLRSSIETTWMNSKFVLSAPSWFWPWRVPKFKGVLQEILQASCFLVHTTSLMTKLYLVLHDFITVSGFRKHGFKHFYVACMLRKVVSISCRKTADTRSRTRCSMAAWTWFIQWEHEQIVFNKPRIHVELVGSNKMRPNVCQYLNMWKPTGTLAQLLKDVQSETSKLMLCWWKLVMVGHVMCLFDHERCLVTLACQYC